jgi:hypothetical protein
MAWAYSATAKRTRAIMPSRATWLLQKLEERTSEAVVGQCYHAMALDLRAYLLAHPAPHHAPPPPRPTARRPRPIDTRQDSSPPGADDVPSDAPDVPSRR